EFTIVKFATPTNSSEVTAGFLNGRVITWDASTGQILHDFTGETIYALTAVPGTNQIVSANASDNLLRVKDSHSGTILRTLAGHPTSVIAGVGFSPDGQYVLAGGNELFIRLWNRTNADQVRAIEIPPGGTVAARFSPDGTRILTTAGSPDFSA